MSYPLWAFDDRNSLIFTRGSTANRAAGYVRRFRPHARLLDHVPIDGPAWYGTNHAPGWLERKPVYERRLDGEPAGVP